MTSRPRASRLRGKLLFQERKGSRASPVAAYRLVSVRCEPPALCLAATGRCRGETRLLHYPVAIWFRREMRPLPWPIARHPHTPVPVRDESGEDRVAIGSPQETPSLLAASASGRSSFPPSPGAPA